VQRLSGPADRRRLPLLEDEDLTGEAVIEPSRLIRPVDAPTVAVACFFRDVVEELSGRQDARSVCRLHSEMGPASLWEIEHLGVRLGVFHPGVGAPLAGALLEQVIARGVRGVIACGAAGALVPELVMGHAVILTGAVRDEGTSFHYLPAGRVVSADPGPAESLADALSAAGVETTRGLSWSMDAIYRETQDRPLPLHPVRRGGDGRRLAGRPGVAAPWVDDGQVSAPAVVRLGRGRRRRVDEVTAFPMQRCRPGRPHEGATQWTPWGPGRSPIIALRERDGEVAVDTRGSGREIGDALAEVFGREGKTLTLMLLLLLLRPSA
jgi:hypothetical protein